MSDYVSDSKSVMDNAIRIIQAMIDVAADSGWLATALGCMNLIQMILQGRRVDDLSAMTLPKVTAAAAAALERQGIRSVAQLAALAQLSAHELQQPHQRQAGSPQAVRDVLVGAGLSRDAADEAAKVAARLPLVHVQTSLRTPARPYKEGYEGPPETTGDADGSGGDLTVEVALTRRGAAGRGGAGAGPRAYTPGSPKVRTRTPLQSDEPEAPDRSRANSSLPCSSSVGRAAQDVLLSRLGRPLLLQVKEEGWWLVVGDRRTRELYALKRVGFSGKASAKLFVPAGAAGKGSALTLFLVSDCYLGLDQEIRITGAGDDDSSALRINGAGSALPAPRTEEFSSVGVADDDTRGAPQRERRIRSGPSGPAAEIAEIEEAQPTLDCTLDPAVRASLFVATAGGGGGGAAGGGAVEGEEEDSDEEEFWDMAVGGRPSF